MSAVQPIAVDERVASRMTGISVSTLQKLRVTGGGPRYAKMGRKVCYRVEDLDAFMVEHLVHSTSQRAA